MAERKSKARIEQSPFLTPAAEPDDLVDRDAWIEETTAGFISKSPANRFIYRVILETLWPKGHGIPGPIVNREEIRKAVNLAKQMTYIDTFRRLRELQGEEGLLGIVKHGNQYQLSTLNVYQKKTPRIHLSGEKWDRVVAHYQNKCAVCGATNAGKKFQQDHKVPRSRGGTDAITNWQPLCDRCNNVKSTSCRSCTEDCSKCGWAYPEYYRPIKVPGSVLKLLHEFADANHIDADEMVTDLILRNIPNK